MKIIGLTGSIGMGKSTTAKMFADLGCPVFDADAAVHELYSPGGKAVPLIRAVLPSAITAEGGVDRKALSEFVRSDPLHLEVLTSFIHPWVGEMRAAFMAKAAQSGAKAVVFDIPLLFEGGRDKDVDAVVVVTASADTQAARVLARPGMTQAQFDFIKSRQMPDAEKRARADFVISTEDGIEPARQQVKTVLDQIVSGA